MILFSPDEAGIHAPLSHGAEIIQTIQALLSEVKVKGAPFHRISLRE
jgi:hypothetical protein